MQGNHIQKVNAGKMRAKSNAFTRGGMSTQTQAKNRILAKKKGNFSIFYRKRGKRKKNFRSNTILLEKSVV